MTFVRAGQVADDIMRLARVREWCPQHREADFQELLAGVMERFGWVVFREVHCETPDGKRRRIDIVATPPAGWAERETIPAVGVEAKMNHGLGTHKDEFFGKLRDYIAADRWWLSHGSPANASVPKPAIILYATPYSVALRNAVYDWRDEVVRRRIVRQVAHLAPPGAEPAIEAAIDLTQLEVFSLDFDRDLWKRGAAILHGPWDEELWFQTNRFGRGTPKYYLGTMREAA